MEVSATDVASLFNHYLDLAEQGEAIIIEISGKKVAAIVDYQEYQHLKRLEESLLIEKIKNSEQNGYLSNKYIISAMTMKSIKF